MPEAITLFESQGLCFAELRCLPDDDTWGEDADVTHPIIALPGSPTWIVRHGRVRQLVNPNHAVVHQAGDEYRRERFEGRGYRCLFMFAGDALLREVAAEFDPSACHAGRYRLPTGVASVDANVYSLSRRLATRLRSGARPDPVEAMEALFGILRGVVAAAFDGTASASARIHRTATRGAHVAMAEGAKEALTARFTERLGVHDVARWVHASPYHLTRVFRHQTGFALHEYLNQLRLRAALERIREGHDDLASLAAELGFSSHSHLTANFRRAFGDTPAMARSAPAVWPTDRLGTHVPKRARI